MKFTRTHKRYLAVLGVCGLALVIDRLLLAPEEAGAEPPPATTVERAVSTPVPTGAPPSETGPKRTAGETIAVQFREVATARALESGTAGDAFRAPAGWIREDVIEHVDVEDRTLAESFLERHHLTGILGNARGGIATIDERHYRTGEVVDGFRLVTINTRSVVLESVSAPVVTVTLEVSTPGD